jgi:hypothetical protein
MLTFSSITDRPWFLEIASIARALRRCWFSCGTAVLLRDVQCCGQATVLGGNRHQAHCADDPG